ncbi:hypothetical protein [Candidatus Enterovibrio escicola]|uniref:hypothetical protein n=1 Tax=Candidatus Enterovibrio escicola TaxID=1927127 RepID=UPI0012383D1F|nr:hypothetical protein [Candidatus Enterovibrio escacola]
MEKHFISSGVKERNKPSRLSVSEVMTILIGFFEIAYWSFVSLIARLSAHLILAARVLRFFRSSLAADEFDDEERDEFHELADNLAAYSRSVFHSSRMSALAYSEPNSSTVGGSFLNASFS